MAHHTIREWERIKVGPGADFSRSQADLLMAAAQSHPLAEEEGGNILADHHVDLHAQQMVGIVAAQGCSLEILPKVDPEAIDGSVSSVRAQLVSMLDIALGLDIGEGTAAAMAREADSLLDILMRIFADRLLQEARRGLPRMYAQHEGDLAALRGRLDVTRQFTHYAGRTDRLACRFDELTSDTPLMQVMKAAVVMLEYLARSDETRRRLSELRFILADVSDRAVAALPWNRIGIDRTNRHWQSLLNMAGLFLRRDWQATHFAGEQVQGLALLFPMNELFEAYVEGLLREVLAGSDTQVIGQGGRQNCLGDWDEETDCTGTVFQTIPDIILRRGVRTAAIIDAKWKRLGPPLDRKKGVQQADVYQLMAYARVYRCQRLVLLYPALPGEPTGIVHRFGIHGGREQLSLGKIDVSCSVDAVRKQLGSLLAELGLLSKAPVNGRD